jgi:hypothetical protein
MGKMLVIESLTVRATTAVATYSFSDGVTAVTGPIGSGKSSMFELIKYAMGGSARVMPAVRDNVTQVKLQIRVGDERLELTRNLGGRLVDVVDLTTGESRGTWATTNRKNFPKASQEFLRLIGLPSNLRVPKRRTRPTGETVALSFFDVYRYLYLDQNSIDDNVVGHTDNNLNIKRIAVFELLYGLSNPRIMELAAERTKFVKEAELARSSAKSVASFLRANSELEPERLSILRREAEERRERAELRVATVRQSVVERDGEGDAVREAAKLRSRMNELNAQESAFVQDISKDQSVLAQLDLDEEAAKREQVAERTLSGLEFTRCPRCLQSVEERDTEPGHCLLCCQPQPTNQSSTSVEIARIRDQRTEMKDLLAEDQEGLQQVRAQKDEVRVRLARILELLEERNRSPTIPVIDDISDAVRELAEANAQVDKIVAAQARWASHARLSVDAVEADATARRLAAEESQLRLHEEENSTKVADFSEIFNEILGSLRDPWYREAHIDSDTYLPIVDGEPFDLLSVGGARKTLVNVAYHLANLSMAISERDSVLMPAFLIVDSPRKNVGEGALDRSVVDAVYRRLRILQDASGNSFQIIIADNSLPEAASRWVRTHVLLDYENPLVPGIGHPGEQVETVGDSSTIELI